MELGLVALQPVPGMAGVAVEVKLVRAQAARQVDRKETVKSILQCIEYLFRVGALYILKIRGKLYVEKDDYFG